MSIPSRREHCDATVASLQSLAGDKALLTLQLDAEEPGSKISQPTYCCGIEYFCWSKLAILQLVGRTEGGEVRIISTNASNERRDRKFVHTVVG